MRADEYQHRPARAQPPPGLSVSSPGIYRVPEYAHEYGCPIRDRVALRRINRSSLPGWIRVGWIYLVRSKVSLGNLFLLQIHRPNLCCSNRCQELYCTLYDSWKNGWDEVRLLPELFFSSLNYLYISFEKDLRRVQTHPYLPLPGKLKSSSRSCYFTRVKKESRGK